MLGSEAFLEIVRAAPSLAVVEELLGALLGSSHASELAAAIGGLDETTALVSNVEPEAASLLMGLLGDLASVATQDLRERLGSDQWAESILLAINPWMVSAAGEAGEDQELLIRAEVLYGSDWFGIDLKGQAVQAARTLLNLYPECVVDVRTISPAGQPIAFQDYEPGHSQLLRRYNQHPLAITWNRERARLALELAMHRSDAERALVITVLIAEANQFLSDLTSAWARQSLGRSLARELEGVRQRLITKNDSLAGHSVEPAFALGDDMLSADAQNSFDDDDLHSLVDGICANLPVRLLNNEGYSSLAAFVGDTLLDMVPRVRQTEGWYETTTGSPSATLASIEQTLRDLHAVLAEIAYGKQSMALVLGPASTGGRTSALSVCAKKATRRAVDRLAQRLDEVVSGVTDLGARVSWILRDAPSPKSTDWPQVNVALLVELPNLSDWDAAVAAVNDRLGPSDMLTDLGFPLLVPTVQGRLLTVLAMRRGSTLSSAADEAKAWGNAMGEVMPTPTTDALQQLWAALHAMSSLTLRAQLRKEAHSLEDMPSELVAQMRAAASDVSLLLQGSSLDAMWRSWEIETVDTVVAQAGHLGLDPSEVWVTQATPGEEATSEAFSHYIALCAAALDNDIENGLAAGPQSNTSWRD